MIKTFLNNAYDIEEPTPESRTLGINGKYLNKYKPMLLEIVINKK